MTKTFGLFGGAFTTLLMTAGHASAQVGGLVCPGGSSLTTGTYHVVSATGGQNASRTVGAPLSEGSSETGNNSAVTYYGPITMDLTGADSVLVPEGEAIDIVLSSAWGDQARAEVLMSVDGTTYTSLGTTGNGGGVYGAWDSNILRYDEFTVPAGGARYLQVLQENQGVRADGVIYSNQCQGVSAPLQIQANPESFASVNGNIGGTTTTVLASDTLGGTAVDPAEVTLTVVTSDPHLVLDTSSGLISVLTGTSSGNYSLEYQICETASPTNCSTTTESVSVTTPVSVLLPTEVTPNICAIQPSTKFWERRAEWSSNGSDPYAPDTADASVFSRVETFVPGPGITGINPGSSEILIDGADQPTFTDAYTAGDFIDYTVETTAGLPNTWVLSGSSENGGRNGNPFKIDMLMSDDGFVTATRIFTGVEVNGQGFDWVTNGLNQQYLEAGTEYVFRVVFYGMDNPGQQIAQDDFALSADQCTDQGDANFPTSSANGGAHYLPSVRNHYIGAVSPDAEHSVTGDDNASGDVTTGEEDVTFPTFNAGATATLNVPVTGAGGLLNAWIDWNQNEQFEASEQIATDDVIPGGGASGTIALNVAVPSGAVVGDSWARLRWSPNSISDPTANVAEGEIEDHVVTVTSVTAALTLTKAADDNTDRAVGDTINYTYTVTNSGNVDISDVSISDDHTSAAGTNSLPVLGEAAGAANSADSSDGTANDGNWDVLAPGDTVTFTSSYIVTAADGSSGMAITNTATATGTPAAGTFTAPTASESVSIVFAPNTPLPTEIPPNTCSIEPSTEFWQRRAEWSSNGSDPFAPDTADASVFSRVEPFVPGPGLTSIDPGSSQILISGADQATFAAAYAAGDFIDYTVETISGLPNTWVLSGSSENGGRNGNPFKIDMLMSDDNFATATRIFTGVDVNGQGFDWITDDLSQQYLEAGTEYIFRVVFYDMNNPGQQIAQDDFALSADQCADQGDAVFPNSSANGGVHTLPSIRNHYIGAVSPDAERGVSGDDNTSGDVTTGEEDVSFPTFNAGAVATVNVPVTGTGGLLNAWIDWNQNEQFEAGERVATDNVIPGGGASGTIALSVPVPASAIVGDAWARLRWSPNSISDPTGDVAEGELEDHLVTVASVTADLSITKTNTAGVNGDLDQAADTVTSGATTTYILTVTNNGPDAVTGGVVTDVVGTGLTCNGADVVTVTGDGVPAGSFTIADLTGGGIALATLEDTESAVLSYSCTVD